MLGKTHVAVGVASSLAVLHPETMPGVIAAVAGGAIGGRFCDIDLKKNIGKGEDAVQGLILMAVVAGISLFVDYRLGSCTETTYLRKPGYNGTGRESIRKPAISAGNRTF